MDGTMNVGFAIMGIYIVGQIFFIFYAQSSYKKLRNAIVAKGRLISMIPVLTLTTVNVQGPGTAVPQHGMPMPMPPEMSSSPPAYNMAATETKSYPPPYAP